jgi:phosphoglycolate phosphatase
LRHLSEAGWRLGVCTNKPQAPSDQILGDLGLAGFFEAVGGGDRFPARKPDGSHLHATLDLMGAGAEQAVLVGDSRIDLLAARDAQMPVVLVTYGYGQEDLRSLGPDALIDRFDELPAVLESLGDTPLG